VDPHPARAPASPFFDEILRILFSKPEVALVVQMSSQTMPRARIAAAAGLDGTAARAHLEAMAERGVVSREILRGDESRQKRGARPRSSA